MVKGGCKVSVSTCILTMTRIWNDTVGDRRGMRMSWAENRFNNAREKGGANEGPGVAVSCPDAPSSRIRVSILLTSSYRSESRPRLPDKWHGGHAESKCVTRSTTRRIFCVFSRQPKKLFSANVQRNSADFVGRFQMLVELSSSRSYLFGRGGGVEDVLHPRKRRPLMRFQITRVFSRVAYMV